MTLFWRDPGSKPGGTPKSQDGTYTFFGGWCSLEAGPLWGGGGGGGPEHPGQGGFPKGSPGGFPVGDPKEFR
jgi:hypothetical protein